MERGKLGMLQTRVGKSTAAAAFRIAIQLVDQGLIDMDEALNRVTGDQLAHLMFPRFDVSGAVRQITKAVSASPEAAVAKDVSDSKLAGHQAAAAEGSSHVRRATRPYARAGLLPPHPNLPCRS